MSRREGRFAILQGPRAVAVESRALSEPGPRQVRLRLEGCGVCGSNLPAWEGRRWFRYPLPAGAPGHEGWGVIDAIGDEVKELRPGQRVAALTFNAFADYDLAEAANILPLPPELDGQPFPGEALGCALNVFKRADIRAWHTVAVIGVGFMGALLVNLAAKTGAQVIAISRRSFALEVARQMGASEIIPLGERAQTIGAIKELTRDNLCERVIEATGLQEPLHLAGELTAERGRLIIAGFHQDGLREVNLQLWNWRGLDVINAHERDPCAYLEGMRAAIGAVVAGRLDPRPLYTHEFRLEEISHAFDAMRDRDEDFLKALIRYD